MHKYITYRRVSTAEQGKSGLGLAAQNRDLYTYLTHYSGQPYEVIAEFVDILSGSDDNREELEKAIELAKKEKAILLVAKLDRLSRKVAFIASLMEDKKLQFKVACLPQADKFQLHLYAALAEQERDFISQRTIAALKEAKARGVKLGGLRDKTLKRNKVKKDNSVARAKVLEPLIKPLRQQGMSYSAIARVLESTKAKTASGSTRWHSKQVARYLDILGLTKVPSLLLSSRRIQNETDVSIT